MKLVSFPMKILTVLLVLSFALMNVGAAYASDDHEVEFTGTITAIDAEAGSLTVETEDGQSYVVFPTDDDFDFAPFEVGDLVEVEGDLNDDGTISAYKVKLEDPDDDENEIKFSGKVTALDAEAGSLTVVTEDGDSYVVFPMDDDFDFSKIEVGDEVTVKGVLNEDGTVSAYKIKVVDPDDEDDTPKTGFYCRQSEVQHPFGARLAERYSIEYETIQAWFCDGIGWGQIMLALHTAELTGKDPAEILGMRTDGAGWGKIWKALGVIGKPDDAGSPNDKDENGKPDKADKPGKPDKPAKPEKPNKPNKPGKP